MTRLFAVAVEVTAVKFTKAGYLPTRICWQGKSLKVDSADDDLAVFHNGSHYYWLRHTSAGWCITTSPAS